MITKLISGGQSGVDLGALKAAKACGIETGGYAPKGWRTETGPMPSLQDFGLVEDASSDYMSRTDRNVRESDGTVIIGRRSPGSNRTEDVCLKHGKPCIWINDHRLPGRAKLRLWIKKHQIQVLNIAGNRESVTPGIGALAEEFVTLLLKGK